MRRLPLSITAIMILVLIAAGKASAGTVTISSPSSGATVSTSIHVVASATASTTVSPSEVWLDGVKVYSVSGSKVDTTISATAGTHRLTVQSYASGSSFKNTIYVTASTSSTPSTTTQITKIDEMSDWKSCDACAGANGSGPALVHTLTQGVSSPSRDGSSAKFSIYPTVKYANALWWHTFTAQPTAKHFIYDTYFYLTNGSASQALEFDVNHAVDGNWYIFGTECTAGKKWKVYDYYQHWIDTGIACGAAFTSYTWHHLTWEFEKTSDNRMHFVSVTLDGTKNYVNRYYLPKPNSSPRLTIAFQMDGNGSATSYSTWLDGLTLKYW